MDEQKIIPFGKYKNQPIEVLKDDPDYLNWLLNQDWFKARHQNIYNIIINDFSEPVDTPEHNKIQAHFLDRDFIKKFIYVESDGQSQISVNKKLNSSLKKCFSQNPDSSIEVKDFDYEEIENGDSFETLTDPNLEPVDVQFRYHRGVMILKRGGLPVKIGFQKNYKIEIKPSVGDDYPSVLRKMKADKCNVLFLREYTGSGVSEEKFIEVFRSQNINAIFESEVINSKLTKTKNTLHIKNELLNHLS